MDLQSALLIQLELYCALIRIIRTAELKQQRVARSANLLGYSYNISNAVLPNPEVSQDGVE